MAETSRNPFMVDGGIRIVVDIQFDHEQLATMPPQVITALLGGIAQILGAQESAKRAAQGPSNPNRPDPRR